MSGKLKQLNGLAEADVKVLKMGDLKVIALFKRLKPNIHKGSKYKTYDQYVKQKEAVLL